MSFKEIRDCRICGNRDLVQILDLGTQVIQGRFPKDEEPDPISAPLELVKCNNSNNDCCGLVQLKHAVDPDELYKNDYGYRSGLNNTMRDHLSALVKDIILYTTPDDGDVVLDIGSNDSTLLRNYENKTVTKIGIDPGGEQYRKYYPEDIELVTDYFSAESFLEKSGEKKAKIITSISMFYDLDRPMDFVEDIRDCLHKEGIWVLEQSYLPQMLKMNSFDTVCHEHLEYYSLSQIVWMLDKYNLRAIDVEFNDINGGSFRIYVAHSGSGYVPEREKIDRILEEEGILKTAGPFLDFNRRITENGIKLKQFLESETEKGKSIYIYGASTKGNTLLQYYGIGNDLITAAAEKNEDKWGRRTPGTNIPIISEKEARDQNPDYFLVLPWHFKEEFIKRESQFLEEGGHFIFPLPELEIV